MGALLGPVGRGITSISTAGTRQILHRLAPAVDNHPVPSAEKLCAVACAVLVILLSACSLGGETPTVVKTITIGVDLPLTGDEGRAGSSTLNGIRFFVSKHPSLDGFSIAIDARDDASPTAGDTARGVRNVAAFIASDGVLAMIGPFDSSTARAEIPVANRAHLAMVSPATSSRCLTKEPYLPAQLNPLRSAVSCAAAGLPSPGALRPTGVNNYFRLSTTDELQGPAAADYASAHLHLLRMVVLTDAEAYGEALADGFTSRFNNLGGTVVAHKDVNMATSPDLTSFLQAAKKDGAQGLYFGGGSANQGCSVRQQMAAVFAAGEATPFLGGDGIALDPACIHDAGTNATGIFATVPALDADHVDSAQPAIQSFKKQFGATADYGAYTMAAYDATGVVYDALDRAIRAAGGKVPARDSIIAELAATTAYAGVTGTFGFDPAGDTTRRVVSIYESAGPDPRAAWTWIGDIDYSTALPY
jgi:branched-chain amino acid transport system substrate-binding protein